MPTVVAAAVERQRWGRALRHRHSSLYPPIPALQALAPGPAMAEAAKPGLGTTTQQQAAELQRLLQERGAKLPELTSSGNVRMCCAAMAVEEAWAA